MKKQKSLPEHLVELLTAAMPTLILKAL